jgi:hypothetical protein
VAEVAPFLADLSEEEPDGSPHEERAGQGKTEEEKRNDARRTRSGRARGSQAGPERCYVTSRPRDQPAGTVNDRALRGSEVPRERNMARAASGDAGGEEEWTSLKQRPESDA